jgi:transposase-like protein
LLKAKIFGRTKKAATDHYLSHGRCLAATVKALGYPVDVTLAAWLDERHPARKARAVGKATGVRHARELKQKAVIDLCARQDSGQAVAQKIGVSRPTLYNWKNQLLGREVPASMKRPKNPSQAPDREELERQVESLQSSGHRRFTSYAIVAHVWAN